MQRSLDTLPAILGVLKAGGAYLPLDPKVPKERLMFMLADCDAKLVLTQKMAIGAWSGEADRTLRHEAEAAGTVRPGEEFFTGPGARHR